MEWKFRSVQGRQQPGHRCYFDCGPVTLQVLDVSSIISSISKPSKTFQTRHGMEVQICTRAAAARAPMLLRLWAGYPTSARCVLDNLKYFKTFQNLSNAAWNGSSWPRGIQRLPP